MSLVIRRAVRGDADLVLNYICKLADYEKLRHEVTATAADLDAALFCDTPNAFCELAYWEGKACGLALWFKNFSTFHGKHGLYLEDLFIDPEVRGRSIGKALLRHLARICVENGWTRFQWSVLDWNAPSIAFYKSLGAHPLDEWTGFRLTGEALQQLASA